MGSCEEVVADIRSQWSCMGVEVESVSDRKIKCRMPPYFEGIQEFTDTLCADHDVVMDMETVTNNHVASVVFIIYTMHTSDQHHEPHRGAAPLPYTSRETLLTKDVAYIVLMAMCVFLQCLNLCGIDNLTQLGRRVLKAIFP